MQRKAIAGGLAAVFGVGTVSSGFAGATEELDLKNGYESLSGENCVFEKNKYYDDFSILAIRKIKDVSKMEEADYNGLLSYLYEKYEAITEQCIRPVKDLLSAIYNKEIEGSEIDFLKKLVQTYNKIKALSLL